MVSGRTGDRNEEKAEHASLATISRALYEKPLKWKIGVLSCAALFLSTNVVSGFSQQDGNREIAMGNREGIIDIQSVDSSSAGFLIKPSLQTEDGKRTGVNDILLYTVKSGDTISYIASRFNIAQDTILAANGLNYSSILREGRELLILPVDGLLHKVQKDDTLDTIAKKYSVDKNLIIAQNRLNVENIPTGDLLIIPGAKRIIINPATIAGNSSPSNARYASAFYNSSKKKSGSIISRFAYNCVKAERLKNPDLPYGLYTLREKESQIEGDAPLPGATVVTSEGGYTGHVAHVEKVEGDQIYISECNYHRGKCTTRWLDKDSSVIKGYIY